MTERYQPDDFVAPPPGPPPPEVPEGWVARWDQTYHAFYYVNLVTKKSQWEKPTAPPKPESSEQKLGEFSNPPPYYSPAPPGTPELQSSPGFRQAPLAGPYTQQPLPSQAQASSPYPPQQYPPQQSFIPPSPPAPADSKAKSTLGSRLSNLFKSHTPSRYPANASSMPGQPAQQVAYAQQQAYGVTSPAGYSQQTYSSARKSRIGPGGAALLGAGGGVLGGMLLADAIEHHDREEYEEGFQEGADFEKGYGEGDDYGDSGADFDGGDFDGGDVGDGDY